MKNHSYFSDLSDDNVLDFSDNTITKIEKLIFAKKLTKANFASG